MNRFGESAEMVRLGRSSITEDLQLPGIYFRKRFRESQHPFYEADRLQEGRQDQPGSRRQHGHVHCQIEYAIGLMGASSILLLK